MLAVGNICLTWEAPGVITLHLEVFLIVEGRGPFRGYYSTALAMNRPRYAATLKRIVIFVTCLTPPLLAPKF